jgi:hypothetical protein
MEEYAVLLVADLAKIADYGRYRAIPSTGEANSIRILRRNLKCRPGFNELTAKAVLRIMDFEPSDHTAPLDDAAHGRVDRGTRYQRAIRKAIGQGDPVEHGYTLELERGGALPKMRNDIIGGNYTGLSNPEQPVRRERVNPGIVRVDFGGALRAPGKDQS